MALRHLVSRRGGVFLHRLGGGAQSPLPVSARAGAVVSTSLLGFVRRMSSGSLAGSAGSGLSPALRAIILKFKFMQLEELVQICYVGNFIFYVALALAGRKLLSGPDDHEKEVISDLQDRLLALDKENELLREQLSRCPE